MPKTLILLVLTAALLAVSLARYSSNCYNGKCLRCRNPWEIMDGFCTSTYGCPWGYRCDTVSVRPYVGICCRFPWYATGRGSGGVPYTVGPGSGFSGADDFSLGSAGFAFPGTVTSGSLHFGSSHNPVYRKKRY